MGDQVERFKPVAYDDAAMEPADHGLWVRYSDYEKLRAERDQARKQVLEELLSEEIVRQLTQEIVEGSDGYIIKLPYQVVKDALSSVLSRVLKGANYGA